MLQEPHQRFDFLSGSVPVFLRERIDSQGLYAEFQTAPNGFADGLVPHETGDAGETPRFSPAAVAVHDDGQVLGEEILVEFGGQFRLEGGRSLRIIRSSWAVLG